MSNKNPSQQTGLMSPQQVREAVHTLDGLLAGLNSDGAVDSDELAALDAWLDAHQPRREKHPFCELFPALESALQDRCMQAGELRDLRWLCGQLTRQDALLPAAAADMARLRGMLRGILADGRITADELNALRGWMRGRDHLRRCWPYDEIESLVYSVLLDGRVDAQEQEKLASFFDAFAADPSSDSTGEPDRDAAADVTGVCALAPEIELADRSFSFAGQFNRYSVEEMVDLVRQAGGAHHAEITERTDYLIVGGEGNPCWTYACYGRRVERAICLRQQGAPLLIVHEFDFCDAIEDEIEA